MSVKRSRLRFGTPISWVEALALHGIGGVLSLVVGIGFLLNDRLSGVAFLAVGVYNLARATQGEGKLFKAPSKDPDDYRIQGPITRAPDEQPPDER